LPNDNPTPTGASGPDQGPNARYEGFSNAGSAFMSFAGITLAGSVLGGVLAIIDEAMIARFLGVESYGLYALAFMLARIGSLVAAFGLPVTILHFLPVYLTQKDKERALGLVIGSSLAPLIGGSLYALGLWLLSDWLAIRVFHESGGAIYIRSLALAVPFSAMIELLAHLARGFGRAGAYVIIRSVAPPLCYMGALLYLIHFGSPKISVTHGLVGSYAFATALGVIFVANYTYSTIGRVKAKFEFKELYSYAVPVVLNMGVSLALFWTDLFQLGIFTNADTVGIYRACMQIVVVFDIIWTAYSAAAGPIYPVLIFERRYEQLRSTYLAAVHLATLLATPAFLLIVCNGSDLLSILGPRFTAGTIALALLAFGNLVKVSLGAAGILLILGGKQRLEAFNAVIAAVLNMLLNYILIPRLGLAGAAISTMTSLIVLSIARLIQVGRVFPITALDPNIFRVVIVTAPVALITTWITGFIGFGPGTGIGHLLLRLIVTGLLVLVAIWTLCLNQNERSMLLGLLNSRKSLEAGAIPPAAV
jgi:O-antigen/teichoic acid export membrane protein